MGSGVFQSTKEVKIKNHVPRTNILNTSIITQSLPTDWSTSEYVKLWILPQIQHSSSFTQKCKKMLFTTTSRQISLKILLSSTLVKMTCQREVLSCLYLNLLKSSRNKEEINLQWKAESSSTARKKKPKHVSILLLSGLFRNTINAWWVVQFISAVPREVLDSAMSVVQFPESSGA